jgi:hypothetical protein
VDAGLEVGKFRDRANRTNHEHPVRSRAIARGGETGNAQMCRRPSDSVGMAAGERIEGSRVDGALCDAGGEFSEAYVVVAGMVA